MRKASLTAHLVYMFWRCANIYRLACSFLPGALTYELLLLHACGGENVYAFVDVVAMDGRDSSFNSVIATGPSGFSCNVVRFSLGGRLRYCLRRR